MPSGCGVQRQHTGMKNPIMHETSGLGLHSVMTVSGESKLLKVTCVRFARKQPNSENFMKIMTAIDGGKAIHACRYE